MQTQLSESLRETLAGQEADRILRACVHCGFCTATCPTYQLLGDELDGPRGRIYQIKRMLEKQQASDTVRLHLDRCLSCRSCETTCPSGVRYLYLLESGRHWMEEHAPRPLAQRVQRWLLRQVIPYPARFGALLRLGRRVAPLLPARLRDKLPPAQQPLLPSAEPPATDKRVLLLEGCAQQVATPNTNAMARELLGRLGYQLISPHNAGCCGAVSYHLQALEEGRDFMRRNIDAWWPHVEQGVEAILVNASGCGLMVKEYERALAHDPAYAEKAERVSALLRDPVQLLLDADLSGLAIDGRGRRIAFQSPCTQQHGLQLAGQVERLLTSLGFELVDVPESHLCCGSSGTYSLTQPELAGQLRQRKLGNLLLDKPECIVTANIGCQLHLQSDSPVPVRHWLELLRPG